MADNHLQFAEVIPCLTKAEADWILAQLDEISVFGDREYLSTEVPISLRDAEPDWRGCRMYRDMPGFDPRCDWGVGFELELKEDLTARREVPEWGERYLLVSSEDWGDVERVAYFVHKFLQRWRPRDCWSMEWAACCSQLRVGQFGGGGVFVTAANVKWIHPSDRLDEHRKAFLHGGLENDPRGTVKCLESRPLARPGFISPVAVRKGEKRSINNHETIYQTNVHGISVTVDERGAGTISSDLHEDGESDELRSGLNVVESLVLAHALAGIDIGDPAYVEGLETAIDAVFNLAAR